MRFAAGLTVSGILGFIVYEILKLILPTLAAWAVGFLLLLFKILLIGTALMVASAVIGFGIFWYKRSERARAES